MIEKELDRLLKSYIAPELPPEEYVREDLETLIKELHSTIPQLSDMTVADINGLKYDAMYEKIRERAIYAYQEHERTIVNFYNSVMKQYEQNPQLQELFTQDNIMRNIEKDILLRVVDNKWIDHLHNIDMLRDGIGLRAYGQKDPLIEYKKEAYDLFNRMMFEIQSETVKHIFRTKFGVQIAHKEEAEQLETELSKAAEEFKETEEELEETRQKIAENDSCPCGSGKKYKDCCGKDKRF